MGTIRPANVISVKIAAHTTKIAKDFDARKFWANMVLDASEVTDCTGELF